MIFFRLFLSFLPFIIQLPISSEIHEKNEKNIYFHKPKEAKKKKEKKNEEGGGLSFLGYWELMQKNFALSAEKFAQAEEKENSVIPNLQNCNEVVASFHEAAFLYAQAAQIITENLEIIIFFNNQDATRTTITNQSSECLNRANKCLQKAAEWPCKAITAANAVIAEIDFLKKEGASLEKQDLWYDCQEVYRQLAFIYKKLIENGIPDTGELKIYEEKVVELETLRDEMRLTVLSPKVLQDAFIEEQLDCRSSFFNKKNPEENISFLGIPLDGQKNNLYINHFYRYLIQSEVSITYLHVKVFENSELIHEELIEIPLHSDLWQHYLVSDQMLLIPKTLLNSKFGLDLRLTRVADPYSNFSLLINQKGSNTKYDFSFFFEDKPLYDIHFICPPPHQLNALQKPALPEIRNPSFRDSNTEIIPAIDNDVSPSEVTVSSYFILDQFVKDLKQDPLALAQYVHNEIETVDPFLTRNTEGIFIPPAIHRNPLRTFLEGQGSAWEQCMLLAYFLQTAGYQTQYIEGAFSLPVDYVEQLLFLQLPDEEEIILDYPGVLFFDGENWHSFFPWMKEIETIEGYELYSLMPEEYGNAERWLKKYLYNDEKIFKYVGPDRDDTAGVLFVRFVEEQLRQQGLSLQEVGTHRKIHKRQFNTWEEFPRPVLKGQINTFSSLVPKNHLFAGIKFVISSEQQPGTRLETNWLNLCDSSCGTFAIYFTALNNAHLLHFCFSDDWKNELNLPLNEFDQTIKIEIHLYSPFGSIGSLQDKREFSITKGTCAAACYHSGSSNAKITSFFAEKFNRLTSSEEKLHALVSFVGASYFEKCTHSSKILASLHKVNPSPCFFAGLSKLSPNLSVSDLRFPQIDMMQLIYKLDHIKYPFSKHQEIYSAIKQYQTLDLASTSSNEHQVLREIYQDPYAISTVKLLQIAHQNHKRKGGSGTGFLTFTSERFALADTNPVLAQLLYFSQIQDIDLAQIKIQSKGQWEGLRSLFNANQNAFTYAYMTPGPVSSLDGFGLTPPSYMGIGTLALSHSSQNAWISAGSQIMNGGYGSKLPNNFLQTVTNLDWKLILNGNSYHFFSTKDTPIFYGVPPYALSSNPDNFNGVSDFKLNESPHLTTSLDSKIWRPFLNLLKAEVRQGLKSSLEMVADPVDVISGAFYIDEADLTLQGPFPLEVRRNYSSGNFSPGFFGYGWKLSLNPFLYEERDKLFASEQDGSVIVYRRDDTQNRWIVLPEDNPELKNFNQRGIGGIANPFNAYIQRGEDDILYGSDGSKRVFHNKLLTTWSDHAGNTLTFIYEKEKLKGIQSSSGAFLGFEYNHGGKICEAFTKDGRKVRYNYNYYGNLSSVVLPNDAVITYDYDRFHRIIREIKPHGRILENVYKDGKVVEQRSPIGPKQQMITSATFQYEEGMTTVIDGTGGRTEYKIYNNQIYKIIDPEGFQTLQSWFFDNKTYFDAETETVQNWYMEGAYARSLKSSRDKRGLTTSYLYDEKGNIQEISLTGDDLTGNGDTHVSKQFLYNSHNLCTEEKTLNTKTITSYDTDNPFFVSRIEKYVDDALISFIDLEYTPNGLISKKNHSGSVVLFEFDHRDFLIKKVEKTGTDDPDVITSYFHNDQGQCVDLITADAIRHNEYDIMGNQCCSTISLPSGKILSKTHYGYDLNNELIWKQGDDPGDITFFDYNSAGLTKATRKNLTQINGSSIQAAGIAYTLYEYDACSRLIEQVDPLGNCTYSNYDAVGRVISTTKDGLTHSYTYEAGGLMASMTKPGGSRILRSYTTTGLLKNETYPDGTQTSCCYDFFNRPVKEVKNGIATNIHYDDSSLEEIRTQGGLVEIYQYDFRGNILSITDKAGCTWTKTYDGLNRLKTETSPDGESTIWNYQGNTIICTFSNGEKTIQRYEAGSLAESQTLAPDGSVLTKIAYLRSPSQNMVQEFIGDIELTTWTNTQGLPIRIQQGTKITTHYYDPCGNCMGTIDGDGHFTSQTFDPSGRLTKKILPDGAVIEYEYDCDSNLIAYYMPENLSWKAAYDNMGRKIAEWQEARSRAFQKWEYTYENGFLLQTVDPLKRAHTYTYDPHGRLIEENISGYKRSYCYDPRGLLSSIIELGKDISKVERSYDNSGRLIQEQISLNGAVIQNSKQSWTSTYRSLQIGDHQRGFHYQGGQLKSLSSNGINLNYDYAASGSLIQKTTPFTSLNIEYNASALPKSVDVSFLNGNYKESLQWTAGGKLASYESTYPKEQTSTYSYTPRGFLKTVDNTSYVFDFDKPGRGIRTASPNSQVCNEGLDEFGRIIKEMMGIETYQTAYNEMGQIILHDKKQLSWDPWGRLIEVSNDKFEWTASYDALGRRLQTTYSPIVNYYLFTSKGKPTITHSFYDPENEFREIGVSYGNTTFWKLYGSVSCDAVLDNKGNSIVLHHDIKNNLKAAITSDEIFWNEDGPTPYGPRAPPALGIPDLLSYAQSLTWQSQRVDSTGLIWLGARYYNPKGGRFLSPDPICHPACLDLYAYANGDPINNYDLNGRFSSPVYKIQYPSSINQKSSLPRVGYSEDIENYYTINNPSRKYDLGRPELPNGLMITFINGMSNTYNSATKSAEYLSDLSGGYNVHGVYSSSTNPYSDITMSLIAYNHIDLGVMGRIHEIWNDHFDKYPDSYILHFCHSRGGIDSRNSLLGYSEERRKKIIVVAIAPAAYIYRETCAMVVHYRVDSSRDLVPYILDSKGAEREFNTITTLPSVAEAAWHDHGLSSPTYRDPIVGWINKYKEFK